ncbi:MAG TPA: hypothetical protein VIM71_02210 [Lacunisphaera sp.]
MMQKKDCLIVALAPLPVLAIPLVGNSVSEEWNWTWHDFVFAWVVLTGTTFVYRLMATRMDSTVIYRLGAGLAVAAGFLITWLTAAVQIIGDDNPGNILYAGVILTGLTGVALARFKPAGMARAAFATAFATILVPIIAAVFWPADFSPGMVPVFLLNGFFALMFVGSGLLFRRAARKSRGSGATVMA